MGATAYLKGYKLGGSPQTVASGELRYSGRRMWTAAVSVNYAGRNYIYISPVRRMRRVLDYATSPEALQEMTSQEQFGDATTVNLFSEQDVPSRQSLPHAQRVGQQPR